MMANADFKTIDRSNIDRFFAAIRFDKRVPYGSWLKVAAIPDEDFIKVLGYELYRLTGDYLDSEPRKKSLSNAPLVNFCVGAVKAMAETGVVNYDTILRLALNKRIDPSNGGYKPGDDDHNFFLLNCVVAHELDLKVSPYRLILARAS